MENENNMNIGIKNQAYQVLVKKTRNVTIKNVPEDLFEKLRNYANTKASGNWTVALHLLLHGADFQEYLNSTTQRLNTLEQELEKKNNKSAMFSTFGGGKKEGENE